MASWFWTSKPSPVAEKAEAVPNAPNWEPVERAADGVQSSQTHADTALSRGHVGSSSQSAVVDPRVAEFFKTFPDPYREHAIERYSKRKGLLRITLYRDYMMEEEMRSARSGVFLEDVRRELREREEAEQLKKKEQYWERLKEKQEDGSREWYEDWRVLRHVPLQEGDDMRHKLMFTSLFYLAAVVAVVPPLVDKWKQPSVRQPFIFLNFLSGAGSIYLANARYKNWFPYDYSLDTTWSYKLDQWTESVEEQIERVGDAFRRFNRREP